MSGHDTVCHLAAMLGIVACSYDKDAVYSVNLEGTRNIINACILNNVEHLLSASSSEVYGEGNASDIDDAVGGTISVLLRSHESFEIYNIGSITPTTINELASKIIEIHGGGTIEYLTFEEVRRKKEFEILIRIPSIEKAEKSKVKEFFKENLGTGYA